MSKEHEQIVLTADVFGDEGEELKSDDVGTIIHIHPGEEAFVVEFLSLNGDTVAIATVLPSQARPSSLGPTQTSHTPEQFHNRLITLVSISSTISRISDGRKISATASRILSNPSIEKIHQTLSVKSTKHAEISQTLSAKLAKRFALGWSCYVTLLTIDIPEERRIYEIEASDNGEAY